MKAGLVNFCLYICKNSELGIVLTATKGLALQKWTSISKKWDRGGLPLCGVKVSGYTMLPKSTLVLAPKNPTTLVVGVVRSRDTEYLKDCEEKIRMFLKDRLGLILHRKKTKITSCRENLMFLGACIRNGRRYVPKKVLARINSKMNEFKCMNPIDVLPKANSHFGYLSQFNALKIKKKLFDKYIAPFGLFMYRKNFESICFTECSLRTQSQNMIDCRTA